MLIELSAQPGWWPDAMFLIQALMPTVFTHRYKSTVRTTPAVRDVLLLTRDCAGFFLCVRLAKSTANPCKFT